MVEQNRNLPVIDSGFDAREISWWAAIGRVALSLALIAGALLAMNMIIYLNAASDTFDERVAAAFKDSYDYGYAQTFDTTYQKALNEGFDKGYSKGIQIVRENNPTQPAVARLVQMHNPTYAEMMAFLAADNTDSNAYIDGHYVCFDYSAELNNNADAAGIQAAYVRIRSTNWGHAVVAFDTVDRGLVYIEPQSDQEVKPVLGQPYPWGVVGASSPLNAADPILQIELIW